MEQIDYKELVELFVTVTVPDLIKKTEGYRINFIFESDAYDYFWYVSKNPFKIPHCWSPNIEESNIKNLSDIDYEYPIIRVHDYFMFFSVLKDIINESLKLYAKYGEHRSARNLAMNIMRRIWLRMSYEDFSNVEIFLKRQLEFYKNTQFDEYKDLYSITKYDNYDVLVKTNVSATWDETPRSINFKLIYENEIHDLPKIHFGIEGDTCYIYGVQGIFFGSKSKKIERSIYKLNKGAIKPLIHPNFVLSMKLFIDLLKKNNITKIKVSTIQVLSYDYHIDISKKVKETFKRNWNEDSLNRLRHVGKFTRDAKLKQYKNDLEWYNHVVDKYDLISKLKTENLIELMFRMQDILEYFHIRNDVDFQGSYLDILVEEKINKTLRR